MQSHQWFLVIAIVALGYVFMQGGTQRFAQPPPPASVNAGSFNLNTVAVSDGMTQGALELDLSKDLDVALLPEIGKKAIRSAAQQGLKEQAFLEQVLKEVSNGVRSISTIDLNGDDVVDPLLVRPEPGGEEQYLLLALHVPTTEAYPLPDATDAEAWKSVETFEVATMTVSLSAEALTVQAQGNEHLYGAAGQQHYVARDSSSSFMQTYLAISMAQWMFAPRMYGGYGMGYGYGGYSPMAVGTVGAQRGGAIQSQGLTRAPGQASSAVRTRAGSAPASRYQRAYTGSAPRSLSQLKSSSSFQRRNTANLTRSGGFGRSSGAGGSTVRSTASRSAPRVSSSRAAAPRRSAFGRSSFGRRSGYVRFMGGGMRFRR